MQLRHTGSQQGPACPYCKAPLQVVYRGPRSEAERSKAQAEEAQVLQALLLARLVRPALVSPHLTSDFNGCHPQSWH